MNANGRLRSYLPLALGLTAGILGFAELRAQAPAECPRHEQHLREAAAASAPHDTQGVRGAHEATAALDQVDARGDQVMGFSHTTATHHFLLTAAGGAIDVGANDPDDETTRTRVRAHLRKVASDFEAGNFEQPLAVHGRTPAGVDVMRAKGSAIRYRYQETARGGRVELIGADPEARAAIHAFLRFQIVEHRTGDPLEPGQA